MTRLPAGSPPLLRRMNTALVLRTIRDEGPLSRVDVARRTGLSKPTVNEVIEHLLNAGYLRQTEADGQTAPRRPGPRPKLLTFRADLGYVLGIDIGANKVLAMVADLSGKVIAVERRKTSRSGRLGAGALLDDVHEVSASALKAAGVSRSSLQAVGVGTPGVVEPSTGRVTLAPQLQGWEGIVLGEQLEGWFPCPVLPDNEMHLAVLAERWRGAARGIDDVVYIGIGIGIGAGIVVGGELYRGANGAAGEIGYLPLLDGDAEPPNGYGRFEYVASGGAFGRRGREAALRPDGRLLRELAGGDPDAVDAEIIFAAARRHDVAACGIVDEMIERLARGIAAVTLVLNPASVIVGGGISRAGALLIRPLEQRVHALVPSPPRFVLSSLEDEAVALGAVWLAIQEVDETLFEFGVTEAVG